MKIPKYSPVALLLRMAAAGILTLAQPMASAAIFPGDQLKSDGSLWAHHPLGMDKHCLLDNMAGAPDTVAPGTAAVLYHEAPIGSPQSDQLFIYLEGGGSCNDVASCTEKNKYPKNKFGYPFSVFDQESKLSTYLYLRTSPLAGDGTRISPFANMNMAMIPYCTGDSHTGRIIRKEKVNNTDPSKTSFYFYGHYNFIAAIDFLLTQQFNNPNLKTIWFMGTSAGAGGTAAQYAKLRQIFDVDHHPERQIHLIEDSTPSVSIEPDHWKNMATWQTKIPGLPCTPPPDQPPPPDSGFASLSSMQSRRAGPPKTKRLVSPSTARTAETSGADSDDYPTGLAYPFPPEDSTSTQSARRAASNTILGATESALDKPRTDTCYYLNETRIFNRSLDGNFRYSILSFQWDNVLPPKKTQAGYELYFSKMSTNDSAVEHYSPLSPYNTKHLYLNNTGQQQTAVPNDPQGTLCGRHVPTNFNTEPLDPPNRYTEVQDAHYNFISGMVIGDSSWISNDSLPLSRCPKDVSDIFPTSF